MPLKFAAICPHPPVIIPGMATENDFDQVKNTVTAMEELSRIFSEKKIEAVVSISPHGPLLRDKFTIHNSNRFHFSFGLESTNIEPDGNLIKKISNLKEVESIHQSELDHGTAVPIFYLQKNSDFTLAPLAHSFKGVEDHFEFGLEIKKIIEAESRNIAFIASGDLSHKLSPTAPAGFSKKGKKFDEKIISLIRKKEMSNLRNIDSSLINEAGQCGYNSIIVLSGVLSEINFSPEILSYEAPFGVGYPVINLELNNEN